MNSWQQSSSFQTLKSLVGWIYETAALDLTISGEPLPSPAKVICRTSRCPCCPSQWALAQLGEIIESSGVFQTTPNESNMLIPIATRSSTPVLWCLVTRIYVLFRLWCRWNRSLLGTTGWWLVKVVNQTWRVPLWDTSPVGCFIDSSINFDSHLCLRWLYGQTTGEEPELHRFQQSSQLGHKRKHEIVGKDVKISSSTYKSFNLGKFSRLRHWWLALLVNPRGPCPKTGPVKEAVSVTWNVFFGFSLQRRKGPRICRRAESCGMFLCMFLYSHECICSARWWSMMLFCCIAVRDFMHRAFFGHT